MNKLQQLVRSVMEQVADGDLLTAKKLTRTRVDADSELRDLLLDYGVSTLIDAEWRSGRSARWHADHVPTELKADYERPSFGPSTPSKSLMAGIDQAIAAAKERLMDYEMEPATGKRLGDCTKPEIQKTAKRLKSQSVGLSLRSAWLMEVAGMLPDNKQAVKAVLREQDLTRLRRRVERQEAA